MDIIQGTYFPPDSPHPTKISRPLDYALHAYNLYTTADPYLRPIRRTIYEVQARSYPLILPYLNRAAVLAQDSPAILTVGVLLLFLLIAMQVLNFVRRVMMFWMRLVMRLVFWGGVAVLVSVVLQRGVGRTVEDLMGWGQELGEVWVTEYRRWEGYQNMKQKQNQNFGRTNARAGWR
jgi:hypothetical protein